MKLPKLPKIGRYAVCILLLVAVFAAYEVRLFQWQIVDGEMYQEISLSDRTDTIELSAARGQILDRNGVGQLIREAVDVAAGIGLRFDYEEKRKEVRDVCTNAPEGLTSIYMDIKQGRRTEVDTISGSIVRASQRCGVPAPAHEMMVRLVHAMEGRVK